MFFQRFFYIFLSNVFYCIPEHSPNMHIKYFKLTPSDHGTIMSGNDSRNKGFDYIDDSLSCV